MTANDDVTKWSDDDMTTKYDNDANWQTILESYEKRTRQLIKALFDIGKSELEISLEYEIPIEEVKTHLHALGLK